jgi:Xaa-Pro aminopeptidase
MKLTPQEEIEKRIKNLQSHLKKEKIESCLILQNVDLFYFSGTIQRSYLFLPAKGEPLLLVQKDFDRAKKESPLKNIIPIERLKGISPILKKHGGLNRIGLECDVLPVTHFRQLEKMFPESEFVDISKAIKQVRSIKSLYEIAQLRHSAKILDEVFEFAKQVFKPGITEIDAESRLIELGRRRGHQGLTRMRAWNQDMVNACVLSGTQAVYSLTWMSRSSVQESPLLSLKGPVTISFKGMSLSKSISALPIMVTSRMGRGLM